MRLSIVYENELTMDHDSTVLLGNHPLTQHPAWLKCIMTDLFGYTDILFFPLLLLNGP